MKNKHKRKIWIYKVFPSGFAGDRDVFAFCPHCNFSYAAGQYNLKKDELYINTDREYNCCPICGKDVHNNTRLYDIIIDDEIFLFDPSTFGSTFDIKQYRIPSKWHKF